MCVESSLQFMIIWMPIVVVGASAAQLIRALPLQIQTVLLRTESHPLPLALFLGGGILFFCAMTVYALARASGYLPDPDGWVGIHGPWREAAPRVAIDAAFWFLLEATLVCPLASAILAFRRGGQGALAGCVFGFTSFAMFLLLLSVTYWTVD